MPDFIAGCCIYLMAENNLALRKLYAEFFRRSNFEKFGIRIDTTWVKDLGDLFDEDCRYKIDVALNNEEKMFIVLKYLEQQDNISKYKKFITLWKKYDPAKASQFETMLNQGIENAGLREVDNGIKMESKGI